MVGYRAVRLSCVRVTICRARAWPRRIRELRGWVSGRASAIWRGLGGRASRRSVRLVGRFFTTRVLLFHWSWRFHDFDSSNVLDILEGFGLNLFLFGGVFGNDGNQISRYRGGELEALGELFQFRQFYLLVSFRFASPNFVGVLSLLACERLEGIQNITLHGQRSTRCRILDLGGGGTSRCCGWPQCCTR